MSIDHNGESIHFAYSRRATQIAKENHGYDEEKASQQAEGADRDPSIYIENVLRLLWVCHLPFEPDLSFEDFDAMFFPVDYAKLGQAWNDVMRKQVGLVESDEAEDPPKKAKGRAKGK